VQISKGNHFAFKHFTMRTGLLLGKTMAEHLRMAACYWHNFCWQGSELYFGANTFDSPLVTKRVEDGIAAKRQADAAYGVLTQTGISYY